MKEENRAKEWLCLSQADQLLEKNSGVYDIFVNMTLPDIVYHRIEIDLDRTRPVMKGEQKDSLRRVLRAFAAFNQEVSYVQGLNYLTATLLYYISSEEEVFWVLVQLIKRYSFIEYYKQGMPGLTSFFEVLQNGIEIHAKKLAEHFEQEGIATNMFAMKWALTLFGCQAEIEQTALIMDLFLQIGWDFPLNLGLALLINSEKEICQLPSEDILVYIEKLPATMKSEMDRILSMTSILMHRAQKLKNS